MLNFKQFFLSEEQRIFDGIVDLGHPIRLYKGSNSSVYPMVKSGWAPTTTNAYGGGNGQGAGFYCWTNEDHAKKHSIDFSTGDDPTRLPMLITIEIPTIDCREWDIDNETHSGNISTTYSKKLARRGYRSAYKNDNLYNVQNHPDDAAYLKADNSQNVDKDNNYAPIKSYVPNVSSLLRHKSGTSNNTFSHEEGSISHADILAPLYMHTQRQFPNVHLASEAYAIKKALNKNLLMALRYVGKQPLKIVELQIFKNNIWNNITHM